MIIFLLTGDYETWERFIYKAAKGSYKAKEWFGEAEVIFAERKTKIYWEYVSNDLEKILIENILPELPYKTFDEFLSHLLEIGCLEKIISNNNMPFNERDFYAGLWGQEAVDTSHLMHDSALFCFHNWSISTYFQLQGRMWRSGLQYNSQDTVAAMLFIVLSY